MKKIWLVFACFLFVILTSCGNVESNNNINNSKLEVINMNNINGEYYLTVDEDTINLNDYIVSSSDFVVKYLFKEYNSNTNSLLFNLKDGNNNFTITSDNIEIKLHIYKNFNCTVNFIDNYGNKIYSTNVLCNSYLNDSITCVEEFIISTGYKVSGNYLYEVDGVSLSTTTLNSIKVISDMDITVMVDPIVYDVTIKYDDNVESIKLKYGEEILLNDITKVGYKFLGWYVGDVKINGGDLYYPELGSIIEARFDILTYTVIFKYDEEVVEKTYQYNEILKDIEVEKEGYIFNGWYLNDSLFSFDDYHVTSDLVLLGKFNPKTFSICYIINGEEIKEDVLYGSSFVLLDKSIPGYNFDGWYLEGVLFEQTIYNIMYDIILIGKYSPKEYKIIYEGFNKEDKVKYLDNFSLYEPVKEGYEFLYWEYNGKKFEEGKFTYFEDITLKAVFKLNDITINIETFGGKCNNLCEVDIDGNIVLPVPTFDGYKFMYWCTDMSLTNKVEGISANTYNNETLYAYYMLDDTNLKDSFIITRVNEHATNYDELAIFDKSMSGFTSKYWHKIGIKENDGSYYILSIAKSGDALSTLGDYDFVVLAYADYAYYKNFLNGNYQVGDEVHFLVDPSKYESGKYTNIISITKQDVSADLDKVQKYLEEKYLDVCEITEDIELVSSYNQYYITWETSNKSCITSSGKFIKPYVTRNVVLTAYLEGIELYSFTVRAIGEKDTSDALSTGYIYTPYSTITQNAMNMLDIIYCAFLNIDENADFTNLTRVKNNLNNYILPKAAISKTKVVISVNQENSNNAFSTVSASAILRDKLATNILNFIIEMGIDGIDIDWETPSSSEATNFTLLMKAIYEKVKAYNSELLVTAAIGGGKWAPPKYDLTNSKNYLDYINLMTYSMASGSGYYQNSLYKSSKSRTLVSCSIEESIKIYNDLTVENSKILVGIPFYVTVQTGCDGPGTKTGSGKSIWYNQMFTTYKLSDTMKEYFDYECGVPYRYDEVNKIFISFDNRESIKIKCDYINTLGLAGIMYWQYGQDVDDMLTNAIKEYINK